MSEQKIRDEMVRLGFVPRGAEIDEDDVATFARQVLDLVEVDGKWVDRVDLWVPDPDDEVGALDASRAWDAYEREEVWAGPVDEDAYDRWINGGRG